MNFVLFIFEIVLHAALSCVYTIYYATFCFPFCVLYVGSLFISKFQVEYENISRSYPDLPSTLCESVKIKNLFYSINEIQCKSQ